MPNKCQTNLCKRLLLLSLFLCVFTLISQIAVGQSEPVQDQLAQQKFEFERDLENRKIRLEWCKTILIALPLFVGLYSIHKQIKTAFAIKEVEARNSFELKTAEILLNSRTPGHLHLKAKALIRLFPQAPLPANFAQLVNAFNPDEFFGPGAEWKLELFKALAQGSSKKEELVTLWKEIFPEDKWIERLSHVQVSADLSRGGEKEKQNGPKTDV